jgi:hypothetical protein
MEIDMYIISTCRRTSLSGGLKEQSGLTSQKNVFEIEAKKKIPILHVYIKFIPNDHLH